MKKLIVGLVVMAALTGCDYKDIVLSHVAPVTDEPSYTTPPPCANAPYHQTFERLGINRPC